MAELDSNEVGAATEDYRRSHLERGAVYDANLSADPFDAYMTEVETRILRRIVGRHFGWKIPRYLDFACGTGRITSVVAPFAAQSFGIDVSESMVNEARRKLPQTEFTICDVTRDAVGIAPVDLVTTFRFVGNAQDELRVNALRALHGLLLPGGLLVLNNHRNPMSIREAVFNLAGGSNDLDLSYFKLRRLLSSAGFAIARSYGVGLWIVRSKLARPEVLGSPMARWLENLSRVPGVAPICPDMVIVARKAS